MRAAYRKLADGRIEVQAVLSRRNLKSLLAKLDGYPPNSSCTLIGPGTDPLFILTAEEDDVHYKHPSRKGMPPGEMHPETETHA